MIIIYHDRDLDGYTSGAILLRKYPKATLVGYDYGRPLPDLNPGEPVTIADVSMPMEQMLEIAKNSDDQLTWIDHHKSAIDDYEKFKKEHGEFMTTHLRTGIAACELCWEYCYPNTPIPEAVTLLGMYDTWRKMNDWDDQVLPFQYGMRSLVSKPEDFTEELFSTYSKNMIERLIKSGKVILKYLDKTDESIMSINSFKIEFENLRAICLNTQNMSSNTFKSLYNEKDFDLMMPFSFNGSFWKVSLYTTKEEIDCSVLAKKMGGGGHKKAAGFQLDNIEDLLKNKII